MCLYYCLLKVLKDIYKAKFAVNNYLYTCISPSEIQVYMIAYQNIRSTFKDIINLVFL